MIKIDDVPFCIAVIAESQQREKKMLNILGERASFVSSVDILVSTYVDVCSLCGDDNKFYDCSHIH